MTGALLAQMDVADDADEIASDPELIAETVAAAAYLHGSAAAIASESEQCGWEPPELFGMTGRSQRFNTLGHPIVASDVVAAIPDALADVIS